MSEAAWSYDLIADLYATDMGQSMPFDDVGYYRDVCLRQPGPALELGCGTGRILLPLRAAGADVFGVDRSLPMLRRLRQDAGDTDGAPPRLAQMDLRALAFDAEFATILAPYSLVTYLTDAADLKRFLATVRELLAPSGVFVLDAFVPRDVASFEDFRLDYRRPHGAGWLERHKRIRLLPDGCNRIERRYRLFDRDETLLQECLTLDVIRPYRAEDLSGFATASGLRILRRVADYGPGDAGADTRFCSLELAR